MGSERPASLRDLPLEIHPSTKPLGSLVILLSGDGGWRDIDQQLTQQLNNAGIDVVGLNSLMYFYGGRTATKVSSDIDRIVAEYGRRWPVRSLGLVGYSFGADIIPFAWRGLSPSTRKTTSVVALIGLEPTANFRVTVLDLLGIASSDEVAVGPALRALPIKRVICFYGTQEREANDTGCLTPELDGARLIERPGGHHFDENYLAISKVLVDRLVHHAATAPPSEQLVRRRRWAANMHAGISTGAQSD